MTETLRLAAPEVVDISTIAPHPENYRNQTAIYALLDPRDGRVRYIGKTVAPARRLRFHLAPSQLRARSVKNSWLKALLAAGLRPLLHIIDWAPPEEADRVERAWIARYGAEVTNGTLGGDGGAPSADTRARMSASARRERALKPGRGRGVCQPQGWMVLDPEGGWHYVQGLRAFSRHNGLLSLPYNLTWRGWQAWKDNPGLRVWMEPVGFGQ